MVSRSGIPQGSATSPLIASIVMARLLEEFDQHLGAETYFVSYADNVGIYGPEPMALMRASSALKRECSRCRFGTLWLNPKYRLVNANMGFDFLGYRIRRVAVDGKSRAVVTVSPSKIEKFKNEVKQRLRKGEISSFIQDLNAYRTTIAMSVREFITGWINGHSCVPRIGDLARDWAYEVAPHLHQKSILKQALGEHNPS